MNSRFTTIIFLFLLPGALTISQQHFRSGIFLHHSTGANIWGPNGGQVSVPGEIARYNQSHNLHGSDSIRFVERWWPTNDNEWVTWHNIFYKQDPVDDIQSILDSYPVIMIKSCFPSSSISGVGSDADRNNPTLKTIANYKWHWRSIISVMRDRPQNFFVIWTNAPLEAASTNASEAALSNAFCRWAKDTLAAGLDPVVGTFPRNVYVFDFFHLLADGTGMLPAKYAASLGDSHPNADATGLVAPQVVNQVLDAALAYETIASSTDHGSLSPDGFRLEQNWPNPFNPRTVVGSQLPVVSNVRIVIYDLLGREVEVLVKERRAAGYYEDTFEAGSLSSGVYVYRLTAGSFVRSRTMVLVK